MGVLRKTQTKVGIIGLGIIGSRAAANLRAKGHQVYVWSRSPRSAPNFLGSVVEVADLCNIIQIFVSDDAALLDVTRTMAAALNPRHLIAAHATVSPGAARQAAAIVEGQGARYLDAPFTGSKVAAQNGQLVYYVGGSERVLAEARPVLEATSKQILHVGEIGQASVIKIATNMLTAATVQTLSEALAIVRGSGIDPKRLVEALEFNGSRSATVDMKLSGMIAENYETHFSLKHMLKDAHFALDVAHELNIDLPATSATADMMAYALDKGWGEKDFSVVAEAYEKPPPRHVPAPASEHAKAPAEAIEAEEPVIVSGPAPADIPLAKVESVPPAPADSPNDAPVATKPPEEKPSASSAPTPPTEKGSVAAAPRKNTLRIIRDFLKKEPKEPAKAQPPQNGEG
jgi:3-hydroxyisobutyrate dehydrogenase-like beta-hydroxyacid dehydrogenase